MAAAISAAESGARVILLEKNGHLGGTTCLSVGSITATGTRFQKQQSISDTPDEHFEDMSLFLSPDLQDKENLALRRVLVDNIPDTLEWLMSMGLCFFGPMPEPPHKKPRMHNVLPNSKAYAYYLEKACRRLDVDIRLNARVEKVLEEDGHVIGLLADTGQGLTEIVARGGVILASGDFSASEQLKNEFVPHISHVEAINPASTGDGHVLARQLGAQVANGEVVWGPSMRFKAPAGDTLARRLPPYRWVTLPMQFALTHLPMWMFRPFITRFMTASLAPEPTLFQAGAIMVNRKGERFSDELNRPEVEVSRQPGKEAFIVFDDDVAKAFQAWPNFVSTAPGVAYAYLKDYKKTRPDLYYEAPTIDALAQKLGVSASVLKTEIDGFNAQVRDDADGKRKGLHKPPFYALGPVQSWIVFTEGGLAVSEKHEVQRQDGSVIPGLYAVGSAGQGGVILAGHGHHIGWAMVSGRRAGQFAAQLSKGANSPATQASLR